VITGTVYTTPVCPWQTVAKPVMVPAAPGIVVQACPVTRISSINDVAVAVTVVPLVARSDTLYQTTSIEVALSQSAGI